MKWYKLIINMILIASVALIASCNRNTDTEKSSDNKNTTEQNLEDDSNKHFVGTFVKSSRGHNLYLQFEDEKGKVWDFGRGNNNLGNYKLYDKYYMPNKGLVGKKFEISWDSVSTIYFCCNGAMNLVEGNVPTIEKLRLLEEN